VPTDTWSVQLKIQPQLLEIDALIFSSHKTATQSLKATFQRNGIRSLHCHTLGNIGLEEGEFSTYLDAYRAHRGRKLRVISVFREPLSRMISSFFQWYGVGEIRNGLVDKVEDTLIFKLPVQELFDPFVNYIETIDGFGESLDILRDELGGLHWNFHFSECDGFSRINLPSCEVLMSRFDLLVADFNGVASGLADRSIDPHRENLTKDKWYASKQFELSNALQLERAVVEQLYASRQKLIELFFPNQFDKMLANALARCTR